MKCTFVVVLLLLLVISISISISISAQLEYRVMFIRIEKYQVTSSYISTRTAIIFLAQKLYRAPAATVFFGGRR